MTTEITLSKETMDSAANGVDWGAVDYGYDEPRIQDLKITSISDDDLEAVADTETEGSLGHTIWRQINGITDRVVCDMLIEAVMIEAPDVDGKIVSWDVLHEQINAADTDNYYGYKVIDQIVWGLRSVDSLVPTYDPEFAKLRADLLALESGDDFTENLSSLADDFLVAMVKRVLTGETWEVREEDYEDF